VLLLLALPAYDLGDIRVVVHHESIVIVIVDPSSFLLFIEVGAERVLLIPSQNPNPFEVVFFPLL